VCACRVVGETSQNPIATVHAARLPQSRTWSSPARGANGVRERERDCSARTSFLFRRVARAAMTSPSPSLPCSPPSSSPPSAAAAAAIAAAIPSHAVTCEWCHKAAATCYVEMDLIVSKPQSCKDQSACSCLSDEPMRFPAKGMAYACGPACATQMRAWCESLGEPTYGVVELS
jgi:hypothetical protein